MLGGKLRKGTNIILKICKKVLRKVYHHTKTKGDLAVLKAQVDLYEKDI